jgi:hypothetical protein
MMINLQNDEMTQQKIKELNIYIYIYIYIYIDDIYHFIFKVPLDNMIVLHHLKTPITLQHELAKIHFNGLSLIPLLKTRK